MNKIDQIIFELPDQFSKSDFIDAFARTGYSYKFANNVLEKLRSEGKIQPSDKSTFQKSEINIDFYSELV